MSALPENLPAYLWTLDGETPFGRTWHEFLAEVCELRDSADGTHYFGSVNCCYVVFPNGFIHRCFGYWGKATVDAIRQTSSAVVLADIADSYRGVSEALRS